MLLTLKASMNSRANSTDTRPSLCPGKAVRVCLVNGSLKKGVGGFQALRWPARKSSLLAGSAWNRASAASTPSRWTCGSA